MKKGMIKSRQFRIILDMIRRNLLIIFKVMVMVMIMLILIRKRKYLVLFDKLAFQCRDDIQLPSHC